MTSVEPDALVEAAAYAIAEEDLALVPSEKHRAFALRAVKATVRLQLGEAAAAVNRSAAAAQTAMDALGVATLRTDPVGRPTSVAGALAVLGRVGTQRRRLLNAYGADRGAGLTDEEAADIADLLHTCYWKRCGDLRYLGLIVYTGETRAGAAGTARIVCRTTDLGQLTAVDA